VNEMGKIVKCPNCGEEFIAERIIAPQKTSSEKDMIYVNHECKNIKDSRFWAFEFLVVGWHFDLLPDGECDEDSDNDEVEPFSTS